MSFWSCICGGLKPPTISCCHGGCVLSDNDESAMTIVDALDDTRCVENDRVYLGSSNIVSRDTVDVAVAVRVKLGMSPSTWTTQTVWTSMPGSIAVVQTAEHRPYHRGIREV